jgi:hypothetical protein
LNKTLNAKIEVEYSTKKRPIGLHQTAKLLRSKGNHQQSAEKTLRMGDNICTRVNFQNI